MLEHDCNGSRKWLSGRRPLFYLFPWRPYRVLESRLLVGWPFSLLFPALFLHSSSPSQHDEALTDISVARLLSLLGTGSSQRGLGEGKGHAKTHTELAQVAACWWVQPDAQGQSRRKERKTNVENPGDADTSNLHFLPAPNFVGFWTLSALQRCSIKSDRMRRLQFIKATKQIPA